MWESLQFLVLSSFLLFIYSHQFEQPLFVPDRLNDLAYFHGIAGCHLFCDDLCMFVLLQTVDLFCCACTPFLTPLEEMGRTSEFPSAPVLAGVWH